MGAIIARAREDSSPFFFFLFCLKNIKYPSYNVSIYTRVCGPSSSSTFVGPHVCVYWFFFFLNVYRAFIAYRAACLSMRSHRVHRHRNSMCNLPARAIGQAIRAFEKSNFFFYCLIKSRRSRVYVFWNERKKKMRNKNETIKAELGGRGTAVMWLYYCMCISGRPFSLKINIK